MNEASILDRALGAYLGLAVGDALGATVEFMTAGEIAATHRVHRDLVGGGWLRLRAGQVTDDTQMCLALGQAMITAGGWDARAAAGSWLEWMRSRPPDIGHTCRRGIRRFMLEGSLCGAPNEEDGGNGALMRNLPVVLANLHDEGRLIARSLEQAHITHWHALSDAAVVAFARLTRLLVLGGDRGACRRVAEDLVRQHREFRFEPWPGRTSGYVVDTVQTVLHCFFAGDGFVENLVHVVNLGGDADTNGALLGQLAGAAWGESAIAPRWLKRLDPAVVAAIRAQTPALLRLSRQAA